jgi:hypothetical protein
VTQAFIKKTESAPAVKPPAAEVKDINTFPYSLVYTCVKPDSV